MSSLNRLIAIGEYCRELLSRYSNDTKSIETALINRWPDISVDDLDQAAIMLSRRSNDEQLTISVKRAAEMERQLIELDVKTENAKAAWPGIEFPSMDKLWKNHWALLEEQTGQKRN